MDIPCHVPEGESGNWRVERFSVNEDDIAIHNMQAMWKPGFRVMKPGYYTRLMRGGTTVMSNTPAEIRDHIHFIHRAEDCEHILINGLGLGVALSAILDRSETLKSATVIEISEDVINLVGPTFSGDNRVILIHADAFEWKPPKGIRYGAVWHDIWDYICGDNLPEMTRLHRKYGRRANWQGSWCRELCKR